MYDVIVIGARCAGSPTAMLLAKKGYRVLLLDRATFPSDTLSTHQVQIKGGAALKRWGLLESVLGTNCPPIRQASFKLGNLIFRGEYPPLEGVDAVICPRRTVIDKILVDAAVRAGAELRQDFVVEELIVSDGHVKGIRGREKTASSGALIEERAALVVGADGKHSLVAKTARAPEYNPKPTLSCAYYTYWEGLDVNGVELISAPGVFAGLAPTNDGLVMVYTGYPVGEFASIRSNIENHFWQTMERIGLAERLHSGRQAERFYGSADLPNYYRRPYGPGWALVGDAGLTLDPITGQGMGNAFCDAERLAQATHRALSDQVSYEAAMSAYEQQRNADTQPMYEFTAQAAAFTSPPIEQIELFTALARKKEEANRLFGALGGSVSVTEFFKPINIFRIIGPAGMGRVLLSKLNPSRRAVSQA